MKPRSPVPAGPSSDAGEFLDLGRGYPTPALLPVREIREAMARLDDERGRRMLAYGQSGGPEELRVELARFLSARYGHPVTAEELMLGSGISLSLSMACQVFAPAGATVVCEDPTYFHARNIFRTAGVRVHPVPVDAAGMRVDLLQAELERGHIRPALVYCIPAFHNPTAVNLAPERAERLLALAEAHDFLIVADEPYTLLCFDEQPPACMMSYDRGAGRVLSLGSFTKLLAPGLRAGWIHARPDLLERFSRHGALMSGGGLGPMAFAAVHETIESGFLAANIDHLRAVYGERARVMSERLRAHFGPRAFHEPRGGYFVWLELPPGCQSEHLLDAARARGMSFLPGPRCAVTHDASRFLRLCFAYLTAPEIERGVERLADAFASLYGAAGRDPG